MSLPTPELKLGYELFSKLLNWAAGKRQSKRLEELKSKAFQELLKGDAADLDLVASVLKEIHKAADTSAKAIRLEGLYDSATQPAKPKKPERRRKPARKAPGSKG
ncbi:hypothetical protein [Geothrix campi]|jgi:hypothetical protein|uniref:hypothetical protein n=1 Tax=Geothrix campi TaxID=2966450 RepID=UPI0021478A4F|nr:hypothetical protein [Geothrix sp. SG10]